jgi:zinc protease
MTEATRRRGALDLAVAAESLGSSLSQDAGRDGSSLSVEVLPSDLYAALALLSEVALEPRFDPADVSRIKKQWLDDLTSERKSPPRLASLAGLRALLGPVTGAPVNGSPSDVRSLSRGDLLAFHARQFVPENLALVAVGDVDLERLRQAAELHLGRLPRRAPTPPPKLDAPTAPRASHVWLIDRPGSVQSSIFAAQGFPARSTPGHDARQVMNNLLGGLFTSRLNLNLREQHAYTYGVRSAALSTRGWGAFVVASRRNGTLYVGVTSDLIKRGNTGRTSTRASPAGTAFTTSSGTNPTNP